MEKRRSTTTAPFRPCFLVAQQLPALSLSVDLLPWMEEARPGQPAAKAKCPTATDCRRAGSHNSYIYQGLKPPARFTWTISKRGATQLLVTFSGIILQVISPSGDIYYSPIYNKNSRLYVSSD
jgi:hypothetical protein